MIRKTLMMFMIAGGMAMTSTAAEVIVKVAPPHVIVEKRPRAPGPEFVWVNGFHRWNGERYVWEPGRWDRPPHPHAKWVGHRWEKRHGGWVMVEGHWR